MRRFFSRSKLLGLLCSLVLTALGMLVAYQVRPQYDIPFGTATDAVLLRGFGAGEGGGDSGPPYRWSTGDASIILQDVGQQDFDVDIQFNGARPPGQPPPSVTISAGGQVLLKVDPPPQIIDYSFHVPRELVSAGTLVLHLTVNTFSPPGDPRQLGIWTQRLRVSAVSNGNPFVLPPAGPFAGVLGAMALLGIGLILLRWGAGIVFAGSGLAGVLAVWLVAADRFWLTTGQWYLLWPQAVFAGVVFIFLVRWLGGLALSLGGAEWKALERRVLLTIMLAAFVVRFGGQLHPQINVEDLQYHVHRLQLVESGQLLFTTFAVQAGDRYSFYLPTAYVFILPLKWLLGEEALAVMLFTIGISTLGALLVYFIARRILGDGRGGVLAGTLYLIMPISVIIFSWGITTNIFAEFFTLLVLSILVATYGNLRLNRPGFWLLVGALFVGLLGHSAAVQLLAVGFLATLALLWLMSRIRKVECGMRNKDISGKMPHSGFHIPEATWALGAFAIAALLAFVMYYRNWVGDIFGMLNDIRQHNAAQATGTGLHVKISGDVDDKTLGLVPTYATTRTQWILGGLLGFWNEAQAYYRVWPLGGALLGWLLIWTGRRRTTDDRRPSADDLQATRNAQTWLRLRLGLALLGWAISATFFAFVGLALNLYARYMLFALPVVALCGGILLSAIWKRGRAGIIVGGLLLAFFAVEALALWQYRIDYLFK